MGAYLLEFKVASQTHQYRVGEPLFAYKLTNKTVTSSAVLCVQSQAIDLACRTPNWRLWLTACWLPPQGHSILVSRNGYFYSLLHNLRNTNLHCAAKLTVHFKSWQTKCCYFNMYRTALPYCSQHYEKVLLAGLSRCNS